MAALGVSLPARKGSVWLVPQRLALRGARAPSMLFRTWLFRQTTLCLCLPESRVQKSGALEGGRTEGQQSPPKPSRECCLPATRCQPLPQHIGFGVTS